MALVTTYKGQKITTEGKFFFVEGKATNIRYAEGCSDKYCDKNGAYIKHLNGLGLIEALIIEKHLRR